MSAVKTRYLAECLSRTILSRIIRRCPNCKEIPEIAFICKWKTRIISSLRDLRYLFLEFLICYLRAFLYQIVNTKDLFLLHEVLFCRLFHNPHSKASSLILKMELHLSNSRRCILFGVHFVFGAILYRYQYITQGQRSPFVVVGV